MKESHLRNQVRSTVKFWQFISKYQIVPYKVSTVSNTADYLPNNITENPQKLSMKGYNMKPKNSDNIEHMN